MRSFVIGDLVYVKLEVCVVPLLGEILEMQENGLCKLRMCGYSPYSRRIPQYTQALTGNMQPSEDVLKRWASAEDVIVQNNIRADIDKIAQDLEAHLGTKKIDFKL